MQVETGKVEVKAQGAPRRFVFVLLENFSLLSFAAALDCLRIANRMADQTLYTWVTTGESGDTVACSAGTRFHLDIPLEELGRDDTMLICGGTDIQQATTKKLLNWLRREARRGLRVGGLCTA
ncbi:MAG: GlxA family transcriptional regulator, partial [Roseovarius sp.]